MIKINEPQLPWLQTVIYVHVYHTGLDVEREVTQCAGHMYVYVYTCICTQCIHTYMYVHVHVHWVKGYNGISPPMSHSTYTNVHI